MWQVNPVGRDHLQEPAIEENLENHKDSFLRASSLLNSCEALILRERILDLINMPVAWNPYYALKFWAKKNFFKDFISCCNYMEMRWVYLKDTFQNSWDNDDLQSYHFVGGIIVPKKQMKNLN